MIIMLAAMLIFGMATATAEDDGYTGHMGDKDATAMAIDLAYVGVTGVTLDSAKELGTLVCSKLDQGVTEYDMVMSATHGSLAKVDVVQASIFTAEWHYCPEHYN